SEREGRRGQAHDEAPPLAHARSGRRTSTRIRIENETRGAHAGAATAIVTDSLTPTRNPASRAPTGLPRPPTITTAKTTRSHAHVASASTVAVRHASSSSTGTKSGPIRSDALMYGVS